MSDDQKPILGLTSPILSLADRPAILLLEPSRRNYEDSVSALPEGAYPDTDFLALVHTIAAASSPSPSTSSSSIDEKQHTSANLLAESSSLHHTFNSGLNSTLFLETTGYVHFQDEGVKGPEYEPSTAFRDAAPRANEERRAWEGAYERFREGRMGVCGLDLEVDQTMLEEGDDDVDTTGRGEDVGEERLLSEGWVEVVGGDGSAPAAEEVLDSGELVTPEELLPGEANEELR